MKEPKFDLKDISIIPTIISEINSRQECRVYNYTFEKEFLPLMASPMDTVVSENNVNIFIENKIIPCMPRGSFYTSEQLPHEYIFQSFGLNEIEEQLLGDDYKTKDPNKYRFNNYKNVLIDTANGHSRRLLNVTKTIKQRYPNIKLMVGNIANPLTFKNLAMTGVDFIRVGIGGGAGCTTSANVGINYPMGSLIHECREEKVKGGFWNTKIVADGGIKGYDDILKILGLGADVVMIGSLFNKAIESSGFNYLYNCKISSNLAKFLWKYGLPIKKKYRGMSTKSVQRHWGKSKLITAEGITKFQKVEYNLSSWVENFEDYLKSCMSYCGVRNLNDFIGEIEWEYITYNALKRFEK